MSSMLDTTLQRLQATWSDKSVSSKPLVTLHKVDGVNIDNWTFEALVEQVQAFRVEQDLLIGSQ